MKAINYGFEGYFDFMVQALNTETGLLTDITFKNLKGINGKELNSLSKIAFGMKKNLLLMILIKL